MYWSASIIMKIKNENTFEELFQETIVLIESKNIEQAKNKAVEIGVNSESKYLNNESEKIEVKFDAILDIQKVVGSKIKDKTEIFTRHYKKDEYVLIRTKID